MKKLSRMIPLIASAAMFFLTSCNSSNVADKPENSSVQPTSSKSTNASTSPVEITFMHIHGGAGGELVNKFCEEFTQNSNGKYKVTPFYVEGSYEGIIEKLQMLSLSSDLPEITQAGHQYLGFMSENMPIVPLQKFIDRDGYDTSDYFPKMLDLGRTSDGKIAALPFAVSTPVLFYNKEMFEANGIQSPPKTFDELRSVAKQLTKDGNYGIYINYEITGNWEIQSMIENFGQQMLSPDRKSIGFDEAGLKTFELINDLTNVDKSMPVSDGTEGATQAAEMFKAGKVGMYVTTIASLRGFQKDATFTVETAAHPSLNDSIHSAPAGGNSVYILTDNPEKQEAAWAFIKYISAPEQTTRVAQIFGYMVTSQKAYETPALMGDYLKENPQADVTYKQVDYMTPWCNFPGNQGTKYVKITQDNISAMIHGEKTPQAAFDDTVKKLNEIIAQ